MNGWIALTLLGVASAALLWRLGIGSSLWMFTAAALMLGATGYALQGRPMAAGTPARPEALRSAADPEVSDLRTRMFGRFSNQQSFFVAADGMLRVGAADAAVKVLLGAVNQGPDNAANWTALGSAMAQRDGDTMSPAARFAFAQGLRLAPAHPGPPFFLGLAFLRAGNFAEARRWWSRSLEHIPAGFSYRAEVADRLMLLDALLAMESGRQPPPR